MLLAGTFESAPENSGGLPDDAEILLLERATTLRQHSGQVAFPGGAHDEGEPFPVHTALREAQEETGLEPDGVRVLANLPSFSTLPSPFEVVPVLGKWERPTPGRALDAGETARVARIRVGDLLEPANQLANLVLDIAATVTGRVIDENGEGIGGVRVGASVSLGRAVDVLTRWPSLGPTTHTDNDGHYQLSEVPTGSVALSLCDSDGYELERQHVALEPGESKEVDFGSEGGYAVTGIVRIGGVPVENARISLHLEQARQFQRRTDPQGRFRIHGVTEGTYSLWVVWQPGFVKKPTQWRREQLFHVRRTVHVDRDTELDVDLETDGEENL